MAQIVYNLIISVYFITFLCARGGKCIISSSPIIESVHVINETMFHKPNNEVFTKLLVVLKGLNFYNNMKVRATTNSLNTGCTNERNSVQGGEDPILEKVWLNSTYSVMTVNVNSEIGESANKFYLCVKFVGRTINSTIQNPNIVSALPSDDVIKWVHQGEDVTFGTGNKQFLNVNKPVPSTILRLVLKHFEVRS